MPNFIVIFFNALKMWVVDESFHMGKRLIAV